MEPDEGSHHNKQNQHHHNRRASQNEHSHRVRRQHVFSIDQHLDHLDHMRHGRDQSQEQSGPSVNQQQKEVLPIEEPDAVVQPRAVVIHAQHAPPAGRAMVASFRLESVANQAIPPPLFFRIFEVKSLRVKLGSLTQKLGGRPGSTHMALR